MLESNGDPRPDDLAAERASAPEAPSAPDGPAAAYLPFGAYAAPSVLVPAPPAAAPTYDLPSARQVVYAGLQLVFGANSDIRRASIYIGLLTLGAFGPTALLVLIGLARLLGDPATAATLQGNDAFAVLSEQPDLSGPLTLIAACASCGVLLLLALSIDAQAIAIVVLAGKAAGRPLTLREAVTRARQTFWRLFVSGLIVGIGSGVLTLVLILPFFRPFDSNQGIIFIASMISTLIFTPFVFRAAGIVLGDAGATDSLRRSMRLFRAAPRIAVVVGLFALVSAAIQSFALSSGEDLLGRLVGFFHVGEGSSSVILPGILVLAFLVAFGSLTFTIAAIVASPQVAAFLGLTFYADGLDRARATGPAARKIRWVSVPMTMVMLGLAVVVLVSIPSIASLQLRPPSPLLSFMRQAIGTRAIVVTSGPTSATEDGSVDSAGLTGTSADILSADYGYLPVVPSWLLTDVFACSAAGVTCSSHQSGYEGQFRDGALVFVQRMAATATADDKARAYGVALGLEGADTVPAKSGATFQGSSIRIETSVGGATRDVAVLFWQEWDDWPKPRQEFRQRSTDARSRWVGADLVTILPWDELDGAPVSWNVYSAELDGTRTARIRDDLLETADSPMLTFDDPVFYDLLPTIGQP